MGALQTNTLRTIAAVGAELCGRGAGQWLPARLLAAGATTRSWMDRNSWNPEVEELATGLCVYAQSRGPRNLCWTRHDVGGQPSFRGCPPFRVRPASSARPASQALGDDTDNRDRALVFLACRFGESVPVNHGFLPSHVRVSRSMVLPMPCLAVNAALISAIGTLKGGLEAGSSMSFNF